MDDSWLVTLAFKKERGFSYNAIRESSSLYVWSLAIINESIMLYQLNWYLLWQFDPMITHSASFWFLTSHSCSYFDHKLKWVIEASDVCTFDRLKMTPKDKYTVLWSNCYKTKTFLSGYVACVHFALYIASPLCAWLWHIPAS